MTSAESLRDILALIKEVSQTPTGAVLYVFVILLAVIYLSRKHPKENHIYYFAAFVIVIGAVLYLAEPEDGRYDYSEIWKCIAKLEGTNSSLSERGNPPLPKIDESIVRWAQNREGSTWCLDSLLKAGGDPNASGIQEKGYRSGPALHTAIAERNWKAVEILLKHGADPLRKSEYQEQGREGMTAIDLAKRQNAPGTILATLTGVAGEVQAYGKNSQQQVEDVKVRVNAQDISRAARARVGDEKVGEVEVGSEMYDTHKWSVWLALPPEKASEIESVQYWFDVPGFNNPKIGSKSDGRFTASWIGWGCTDKARAVAKLSNGTSITGSFNLCKLVE